MKRVEFLDKLNTAKPALANNLLIPVMGMFWFTGKTLMAYNDQIGISVPLKTDFVGALQGKGLLNLLSYSDGSEVEFIEGKDKFEIKCGRTRIKLALAPEEDFEGLWPVDKAKRSALAVDPAEFLLAVESLMRSVGVDVAVPEQLGITLIPEGDKLAIYSTNNLTLSRAIIGYDGDLPFEGPVTLSKDFCDQMLRLLKWRTIAADEEEEPEDEADGDDEAPKKKEKEAKAPRAKEGKAPESIDLQFGGDHALLRVDNVTLYGRFIISDRPLQFSSIFESFLPEKELKKAVSIPNDLLAALSRANVIVSSSVEGVATSVVVEKSKSGKRIKLHSAAELGEVADTVTVDAKHPDVEILLNPKLLQKGSGFFNKVLFTEQCAVLARGNIVYLVAAFEK